MAVIIVIVVILAIGFLGCCIFWSIEESEEDRLREDEEQMEYLRKWREEHDRH